MTARIPDAPWLPATYFTRGWSYGPPVGVKWHFTAGCGTLTGLRSVLNDRHVSVHAGIDAAGGKAQYVELDCYAYHAYDASHRTFGIENIAMPGLCEITPRQLQSLYEVTAFLLDYAEDTYGIRIPTQRAAGCDYTRPGISCHTDGLAPGCTWDPNGHWDCPVRASGDPIAGWISSAQRQLLDRSPATWDDALAAVASLRKGAPPPPPPPPAAVFVNPEGGQMNEAQAKAFALGMQHAHADPGDGSKFAPPSTYNEWYRMGWNRVQADRQLLGAAAK